jgi:murein DD-endopeptidase MepM/ murein hydrolase activator NlpD
MPESIDDRIEKRIGRRVYLKYVGAGFIGVGVGYGLGYFTTRLIKSSIKTITKTQIITERITETTTVKLSSLTGRVFFDYNGDGVQDKNEPVIAKARVYLKDNADKVIAEAFTDSSGDYKLEDIPFGSYKLYVEADKKFRHMCTSREEVEAIKDGYDIELTSREVKVNIGLMEGYLTLPFAKGTNVTKIVYPDEDPNPGDNDFRDWKGGKESYNLNSGTDFYVARGTKILAAAPGKVMRAESIKRPDGTFDCSVNIEHFDGKWTEYTHLNKIEVEHPVKRGSLIGYIFTSSYLHFGFSDKDGYISPYRDLLNPSAISWWTKDNDPQYPF